jgi:hypothetical protein
MQCSLAVNSGTPAIPDLEDRGADWDPPLHDPPLPNKGAEPPTHLSPKQIRAPTDVGEPMESLRGKEPRHAMGQTSPAPVHAPEGKTPRPANEGLHSSGARA